MVTWYHNYVGTEGPHIMILSRRPGGVGHRDTYLHSSVGVVPCVFCACFLRLRKAVPRADFWVLWYHSIARRVNMRPFSLLCVDN
jgi:hypothetical protein